MTPLDRIARFGSDLVVQAGAGTGKTHALVTLYLHLVGGAHAARVRVAPPRIAVVTFTDKAAGELKERIRHRLGKVAQRPDEVARLEPTLAAAAAELGVVLPDGAAWAEALSTLGAASIGTFHSFAGALLRRHAARAGIDPEFALLDEAELQARVTQAAERAILDALSAGDEEVEALVAQLDFHGTGRARGLVELLGTLRALRAEEGRGGAGLDANYDRAALDRQFADAQVRLRAAAEELSSLQLSAKSEGARLSKAILAWLPAVDWTRADHVVELLKQAGPLRGGGTTEWRNALKVAAETWTDLYQSRRAAPLVKALARLVDDVSESYRAHKRRTSSVDFSDLLVLARDLLRDDPGVRAAVRNRYDAVLVDEFQDTNPVQAELVELIGARQPDDTRSRLFVVGDRKQSIYEFRGADVGVFARAAAQLVERGGGEELLTQSRRSSSAVLSLCNALFARAMAGTGGEHDWEVAYEPARDDLSPVRVDAPAWAAAELLRVGGDTSSAARTREARAIARRIAQLRAEGRSLGEVAVLLRRFTHVVDYLDALREAGLPYFVVRGRGFFAAQEVRDLASALTVLDDPDDLLALVAVLRSPIVGVSDETLARLSLASQLRARVLLDDNTVLPASLSQADREALLRFRRLFAELRATADRLGPAACAQAIVDGADLVPLLAAGSDGEQRVANLQRLVERARVFESAGGDLRAFANWLRRAAAPGGEAEAAQAQIADERDDVVRVMTVHQAKGLEFPIVFVPACGAQERTDNSPLVYDAGLGLGMKMRDERRPVERAHSVASRRVTSLRQRRQRAESLRVFYVAATRARDLVVFSGERVRGGADSWRGWLDRIVADETCAGLLRVVDGDALPAPPFAEATLDESAFPDVTALDPVDGGDDGAAAAEAAHAAGAPGSDDAHEPGKRIDAEPTSQEGAPSVSLAGRQSLPIVDAAAHLRQLVARPAPRPSALTVAVTQLADFELCPRRYQQFHGLGLQEHPTSARAASSDTYLDLDDDGVPALDPLRRGTLAHRLLERIPFAADGADEATQAALDRLLAADGYDPRARDVAEVRAHAAAFLATPFARGLAGAELRRELPFLLAVPYGDGVLYVRGQMDLVVFTPDAVTVIDYKHARIGDPDDYRFQLDAYALAARRLYPQAPAVRTGLAFLKEADPSPQLADAPPSEPFVERLAGLGRELAVARATGRWDMRPLATCHRLRCGYIYRCYPAER